MKRFLCMIIASMCATTLMHGADDSKQTKSPKGTSFNALKKSCRKGDWIGHEDASNLAKTLAAKNTTKSKDKNRSKARNNKQRSYSDDLE